MAQDLTIIRIGFVLAVVVIGASCCGVALAFGVRRWELLAGCFAMGVLVTAFVYWVALILHGRDGEEE